MRTQFSAMIWLTLFACPIKQNAVADENLVDTSTLQPFRSCKEKGEKCQLDIRCIDTFSDNDQKQILSKRIELCQYFVSVLHGDSKVSASVRKIYPAKKIFACQVNRECDGNEQNRRSIGEGGTDEGLEMNTGEAWRNLCMQKQIDEFMTKIKECKQSWKKVNG